MDLEGFDLEDNEIRTFHKAYENLKKSFEIKVDNCDEIEDVKGFIGRLREFSCLGTTKFSR